MGKRMVLKVGLALFVALLTLAVMLPAAHAAQFVYDLNLSGCTVSCGAPSYGTVTVTDAGSGVVTVLLTLANSERVINTGVGDHDSVFAFNLASNPTISISGATPGFALVGGSPTGATAGGIHFDGFGDFEYGLTCTAAVCGNGGGDGFAGPVSFTLSDGASFSATSFAELSTGGTAAYFAVDIVRPSTGGTGAVGSNIFTQTLVVVPEPSTFVLVGTMLVGLGIWARRRVSGRVQPA